MDVDSEISEKERGDGWADRNRDLMSERKRVKRRLNLT